MKMKRNRKLIKRRFKTKFILKNKLKQKFKHKLMPICFAILMIIATTINSFQNYCRATNNRLFDALSHVLNQNIIVQMNDPNDPKANNKINVEVNWDEYMMGTMAGEATPGSDKETLKSQALIIKNYALYHLVNDYLNNVRKPINTTTKFQVYLNKEQREKKLGKQLEKYEKIYKNAIDETKDLIITYTYKPKTKTGNNNSHDDNNQPHEKLANTVYFASAGDKTENAKNVWGTEVPYLTSVDNSFENANKKNIEIKLDEAFNLINSKIKSKQQIDPNKQQIDPNKQQVDPNKQQVDPNKQQVDPNKQQVDPNKPTLLDGESIKIESRNDSGRVQTVTAFGFKFSGNEIRKTFNLPSTEFNINLNKNENKIVFECRGFGHGVGMSQNGADILAKTKHLNFEKIIKYYYPGVEIKPIKDLKSN